MRNYDLLDALLPRTRQNILAMLLLSQARKQAYCGARQTGTGSTINPNPAFALLPELQSLFSKTTGLADQVKLALEPVSTDIDLAFIFGPIARGETTANSDVDVLIVGRVGMADMAFQIPINVTHFTRGEFQDKLRSNNHFLQTVLSGQKIFLKGSDHELADVADEAK